jgi:magnesium-transporting ATPase (P-type)
LKDVTDETGTLADVKMVFQGKFHVNLNENVQPAKTLNHTSSSPKDSPINIRFYTPNPPVPSLGASAEKVSM